MSPCPTTQKVEDSENMHAVLSGERFSFDPFRVGVPHRNNFTFRQLRIVMFRSRPGFSSELTKNMKFVPAFCDVLQILYTIVLLYAVAVIHFLALRQRPDERSKHKPVHSKLPPLSCLEQCHAGVALAGIGMQQSPNRNLSPITPGRYTSDIAAIAHFIQIFVADHWTPCFAAWHVDSLQYVGRLGMA